MGAPFESEESTTVRVRRPLARTLRDVFVATVALWAGAGSFTVNEALHNLVHWWDTGRREAYPLFNTTSLVVHFAALALVVAIVLRVRPPRRRAPGPVRVDERGLSCDGKHVVARGDVVSVEVATDPDLGFAAIVAGRRGESYVVPLRTERAARELAAALAPHQDVTGLVFEGVSGARSSETRRAVLAVIAVVAGLAVSPAISWYLLSHHGDWLDQLYGDRPFTPLYFLQWLESFGSFLFAAIAATALAPTIARRLQPGRVVLRADGLTVGARDIGRDEIARVEADAGSAVAITLRSGERVRAAFAADRPLVERDLFVARVRELASGVPVASYPSAETSGVRIALPEERGPAPEEVLAAAEGDEAESDDAQPRARRRG